MGGSRKQQIKGEMRQDWKGNKRVGRRGFKAPSLRTTSLVLAPMPVSVAHRVVVEEQPVGSHVSLHQLQLQGTEQAEGTRVQMLGHDGRNTDDLRFVLIEELIIHGCMQTMGAPRKNRKPQYAAPGSTPTKFT